MRCRCFGKSKHCRFAAVPLGHCFHQTFPQWHDLWKNQQQLRCQVISFSSGVYGRRASERQSREKLGIRCSGGHLPKKTWAFTLLSRFPSVLSIRGWMSYSARTTRCLLRWHRIRSLWCCWNWTGRGTSWGTTATTPTTGTRHKEPVRKWCRDATDIKCVFVLAIQG